MLLGKYHGLGNDFLVALESDNPDLRVTAELARRLCDRRRGIGADGLILGLTSGERTHHVTMVLLNSDGSRAEISGNGIRCLAQAVLRGGGSPKAEAGAVVRIATDRGTREVNYASGALDGEARFTVEMGTPSPGPAVSARASGWGADRVATIDIGNPHLVLEVDDPDAVELDEQGPLLESDYPDGMNVHFVTAPDRRHLELRVWERGAGVTRACGSGAVAAVAAASGWGIVDAHGSGVEVSMPGGTATVRLGDGRSALTGPSVFVAEVSPGSALLDGSTDGPLASDEPDPGEVAGPVSSDAGDPDR